MSDINPSYESKMTFDFPCDVKQIGPKTIEIRLEQRTFPIFTKEACQQAIAALGARAGERWLDEQDSKFARALLIASIN